jgi:hypothetical protein
MSSHLGGKVDSDMHMDIIYARDCPGAATMLILFDEDGTQVQLIKETRFRYDLLEVNQ